MAVLFELIAAEPEAMGIVLPHGFLRQKQYAELRQLLADKYEHIELTALPQRVFRHASFETAVMIATSKRDSSRHMALPTRLNATDVAARDRTDFLSTGKVTAERWRTKVVKCGDLWIGALDEVWEYLAGYPVLGSGAEVHRGLQWPHQSAGWSVTPRSGFTRGVLKPADSLIQFGITATGYVDVREDSAYRQGPLSRAWGSPKFSPTCPRDLAGPGGWTEPRT
ncbi:MAG: hypothetical protein PGN16_02060 [Sphingomonas phyllosphaerae]|uniref:hypothetical protein n=1 Tax=Sphingomonas phyllosphaerae TaxID=257003 RepID=UPI002FF51FE9